MVSATRAGRWCLWTWTCAAAAGVVVANSEALATVLALGESVASEVLLWEPPAGSTGQRDDALAEPNQGESENDIGHLLAWAATHTHLAGSLSSSPPIACRDCFLVVGVKTRVVEGFQSRQLIRATWAHPDTTRLLNTRVVFLACEPDPARDTDMNTTLHALALEKHAYGDLLTHELGGCVDSYYRLVDKVLGFFQWVSVFHPMTAYAMAADDDVYVRLDRVVSMLQKETTPRTGYYAGQVTSVQFGRFLRTMRDPTHKNYVSEHDYPLSVHCPRAIGAHYVLSIDLVLFIARNRQDLRGVGSIEDLSIGLWLLALLQVHPVHLPDFDTATVNICRNSLVSYGDLSHQAIREIHANVARGDPICQNFSWGEWINDGSKEPNQGVIAPVQDFEYHWHFQLQAVSRAFRIDVTVHVPLLSLTLPTISYLPSMVSPFHFCDRFYQEMSQQHLPPLPPLRCDDLLSRLDAFLRTPPPINAALFALTQSNLPPVAGPSAEVNVWLSNTVIRWRAFIESLLAEMYPDFQVFVDDEHTYADPSKMLSQTFVVVTADAREHLPQLPPSCHLIVLATDPMPSTRPSLTDDQRDIWFTSSTPGGDAIQPHKHSLYVPLASMTFSDSLVHSPVALLQPSNERRLVFAPTEVAALPHCSSRVVALLAEMKDVATQSKCSAGDHEHHDDANGASGGKSTPETVFAFDADIVRFTRAKFVLAFDPHQSEPGFIASSIVAAFLAGSVPIYDGDDATVSRLFNPKAFISCGRFASLQDCGEFVKQVDRSPALYAAMRSEPPVVNETAFYEAFSWHPDVLARLRGQSRGDTDNLDMVERLRNMINSL